MSKTRKEPSWLDRDRINGMIDTVFDGPSSELWRHLMSLADGHRPEREFASWLLGERARSRQLPVYLQGQIDLRFRQAVKANPERFGLKALERLRQPLGLPLAFPKTAQELAEVIDSLAVRFDVMGCPAAVTLGLAFLWTHSGAGDIFLRDLSLPGCLPLSAARRVEWGHYNAEDQLLHGLIYAVKNRWIKLPALTERNRIVDIVLRWTAVSGNVYCHRNDLLLLALLGEKQPASYPKPDISPCAGFSDAALQRLAYGSPLASYTLGMRQVELESCVKPHALADWSRGYASQLCSVVDLAATPEFALQVIFSAATDLERYIITQEFSSLGPNERINPQDPFGPRQAIKPYKRLGISEEEWDLIRAQPPKLERYVEHLRRSQVVETMPSDFSADRIAK